MFWIEWVFSKLPFYEKGLVKQLPIRFLFLVLLWIIGLLAYYVEGAAASYIAHPSIYQTIFGTILIIILGTYGIQHELKKTVLSFRSLLNFDDIHFNNFSKKVDSYFYSFIPNFLIAIPLLFHLRRSQCI